MGLDGVELVMEVEEHFGITIANEEAAHVETVGQLVDLILSRKPYAAGHCPHMAAFLQIRRETREILSNDCLRMRPSTRIEDVVPAADRRHWWERMSERAGGYLPELTRPPLVPWLLGVGWMAALGAFLLGLVKQDIAWTLVGLGAAVLATTIHLVTLPQRVIPPATMPTLGSLTRQIVGLTHAPKEMSRDDVFRDVRALVCEQLGIEPAKVVHEAHFVEDLGMD